MLNHIPPIFGKSNFKQVASEATSSAKSIYNRLESVQKKIADLETHETIDDSGDVPSLTEVDCHDAISFLLRKVLEKLTTQEDKT